MMSASFVSVLVVPAMYLISTFGIHIPNNSPADPAADEARFNAVHSQLDPGGTVYGYISVEGDLTGISEWATAKITELKATNERVRIPLVEIPKLLGVTGLDKVSALGISSKRIDDGFRNKAYILAPNGREGLLKIFGDESKPFDVVKMAPQGTDIVVEQDVNLKVVKEVAMEVVGMLQGDRGKERIQAMLQHPAGPFPFTLDKVLADLDTQVTVIMDADSSWKTKVPGAKGLEIPQMQAAVLVDGLGWVVDEITATVEKQFEKKSGRGAPPIYFMKNEDWAGMRMEIPQNGGRRMQWLQILSLIGSSKPVFLHHKPSGKMVLASDHGFAGKLFSEKPNLASDPDFQKTMDGLPEEGTSLAYVSPAFFQMVREIVVKLGQQENIGHKERFMINTMLELIIPENLRGEGSVTSSTADGILMVSNSSQSHKGRLLNPLITTVPAFLLNVRKAKVYEHEIHKHHEHHDHEHAHEHHGHDDHGHGDHSHGDKSAPAPDEAREDKKGTPKKKKSGGH